ncbi:MAG: hypothetical protein [Caudoviricetes sp.]|nr:MAG: hypothetical protein [Caudoviricetes sp.]
MKRDIIDVYKPGHCRPGHDKYPCDSYKNRRSKKQRAIYKAKEHRHFRRVSRLSIVSEARECD